jgi:CheY-like chemotaxis protein
MASNEIRHRARLVKDYGDVPPARGNESRLGQVFLNLIVNAAQAIPEGDSEHNEVRVTTARRGNQVVVEVRDTGAGIAPEVLSRIFDPFFTTKSPGVGTGLGLAICHRIVTDMCGTITAENDRGHGSVFRVTLPVQQPVDEVPLQPPASAAAARTGAPGTILVIDDEPMMSRTVRRMLAGTHEVVSFGSAREALDAMHAGRSFDVILCDLMMPEMTGMDFHADLLRTLPAMAGRVVFMSGGAFTVGARDYLHSVPNARLEKPFEAGNLRVLIGNLLEQSRDGLARS